MFLVASCNAMLWLNKIVHKTLDTLSVQCYLYRGVTDGHVSELQEHLNQLRAHLDIDFGRPKQSNEPCIRCAEDRHQLANMTK